ncbi:lovastatin nonaketide synthase [Penicillium cf. griseofulvum]|nr:lovastatin nonaketide synthase [Penicillium cf. griseofulvum]
MTPYPNEPIAIIGSGCRFPGNASSASRLWDLLRDPRDCLTEIREDRFNWEGYHHANGAHHGSITAKYTYFLEEDIRKFDPQFFNIQPGEAEAIDPQQRLLLETVYEGLESAGLAIESLQGSSTAVYVGMMSCDYTEVVQHDIDCVPTYVATGISRSIHSNRISYFFDWHGPSMTIDTACSSSMMAVHLAVQSLRSGESSVAVACGANLIISPQSYVGLSNLSMISPDGRAKMWDASANGYARGEGVGALVLKTLSAAIADGDLIDCIIRETSVNQDGRTLGITMPSSIAQADLIRKTYQRAGLDISKRDDRPQYFEAHGTGTMVGDTREAEAVHNAFFDGREEGLGEDDAIHIGSIKTVIGHTEGTAGLAGLLKAALAIKHGYIPPNMLFNRLNPAVEPYVKHLRLATALKPWPILDNGTPRRASVNSFGFGGANGHAILESYEDARGAHIESDKQTSTVATPFVFSAQSERTLVSIMQNFSEYLKSCVEIDLRSIASTLQYKRSTFSVRTAITALDTDDLLSKLTTRLSSSTETPVSVKPSLKRDARILGIFTGQGAQWAGMGQKLLRASPRAREIVQDLDNSLASLPREHDRPSWTVHEEILKSPEDSRIGEAEISQPLCTAIQILLVDMLYSAGVRFYTIVGHSSGEIGAAYAAGLITASDAIRIAYYRGVYAKLAGGKEGQQGAMMAAGISPDEARDLCAVPSFHGRLSVAACNSSASVTISGDHDAINEAKLELDEHKKFARVLKVDTAYHSHHMLPCAKPYLDALESCNIRPMSPAEEGSSPVWLSSVYAGKAMSEARSELSGKYWVANMSQPVLFASALEAALSTPKAIDLGLEVGPHPALQSPALQIIQDMGEAKFPYSGVLARGKDDLSVFSEALGMLWTYCERGTIDFARYDQTFFSNATKVSFVREIPTYPWDHERSYWFESRKERAERNRPGPVHNLLGVRYGDATDTELKWRNFLIPKEQPWLSDHRLQDRAVLPGAAYVVMACEAALLKAQAEKVRLVEVRDLAINRAISFDEETTGVEVVFTLSNIEQIRINSGSSEETFSASWTVQSPANKETDKLGLVASGCVSLLLGPPEPSVLPARTAEDVLPNMVPVDVDDFYGGLYKLGYGYTGDFRAISRLERKMEHSSGWFQPQAPIQDAIVHPALLDVAFQALFAAASYPGDGGLWSLHMPTKIRAVRINPYHCHQSGMLLFDGSSLNSTQTADVTVYTDTGYAFVQAESIFSVPFTKATKSDDRNIFSEEIWAPVDPDASAVMIEARTTAEEIERAYACERAVHFYLKKLRSEVSTLQERNAALHHQKLLAWAGHLVSEVASGKRQHCEAEWANDSEEDIQRIFDRYHDDIDLKLIKSIGQAYPSIIRGESSPMEHLTKDNMLDELYTEGLGFAVANAWTARLIKQISHRYPHMNIIDLGAGTGGTTKIILDHLGSAFKSYTYTDVSTAFSDKAQERFGAFANRMIFKSFDMEKEAKSQGYEEHSYELVVALNVIHAAKDMGEALRHIRSLLKPGGYLVLLELTDQELSRIGFLMGGLPGWWHGQGGNGKWAPTLSTAQWHYLMQRTGYSGLDTVAMFAQDGLAYPFSVSVTQAVDDRVAFLRQPLFSNTTEALNAEMEDLLIVGGAIIETARLSTDVQSMVGQRFRTITTIETLEEVNGLFGDGDLPTTILVLTELEVSIFKEMTATRLQAVKTLFTNYHNLLWVTRGCKSTEPYNNMTIGLGRTAINEQKELRLQFLDVKESSTTVGLDARHLSEMLLRLRVTQLWEREGLLDQILWTIEPEFCTSKDDRLLVPRMYEQEAQNKRYNSKQRQISYEVSPATDRVSIAYSEPFKVFRLFAEAAPGIALSPEHSVSIRVLYSVLSALKLPGGQYLFPIIGRCIDTNRTVLSLSTSNSSLATVPKEYVVPVKVGSGEAKILLLRLVWELIAHATISNATAGEAILTLGVDTEFVDILRSHADKHGISIFTVTNDPRLKGDTRSIFIHPLEFKKVLKAKLPSNISAFLNLSSSDPTKDDLHKHLTSALPAFCQVHTATTLFSPTSIFSSAYLQGASHSLLHDLLVGVSPGAHQGVSGKYGPHADSLTRTIRQVPQLSPADEEPCTIVDWSADDTVPVEVTPVDNDISFPADRTYLLVGLTGDLGQSLCEWFVKNGARHLVLTSRNPKVGQKWLDIMKAADATVKICAMDVTNKASVKTVYEEIRQTLPPIAGVANAAMVMQDVMLSNMELDDLLAVMKPKVDGSRYLHEVFGDNHPLDFFILFSSLSFVTGNSGQSTYAAANGYMASLVGQRRAQGLAGSVMHLGAIIGAGYITRSGQLKSGDLAAFGSYTLSVADFHQLFGEAVLASPPHSGRKPDIFSGLHTIDPEIDDRVLWRSNPKFCHFWKLEEQMKSSGDIKRSMAPVKVQLAEAKTKAEARKIIQECFSARLVVLLQLKADDMDDNVAVVELGVDSLIAVEARSWFTKHLNVDIPVLRILGLVEDTLERMRPELLPKVKSAVDEEQPVVIHKTSTQDEQRSIYHLSSLVPTVESSDDTLSESRDDHDTLITPSSELDKSPMDFEPVVLRKEQMSYAQSRFWFLRHTLEDKTAFNITFSHSLTGNANLDELSKAVKVAANMHEGLRTSFFEEGNVPMQGIMQVSPLYLESRQIHSEDEVKAEYDRLSQHIYNLETGQSMRVILLKRSPSQHYLVVGYHHIAMDGAGFVGFLNELTRIGRGELMPKPIQYADYSRQLREEVEGGKLHQQLSYWRKQFGDDSPLPPVLPLLPFSKVKVRSPLRSYASSSTSVRIDPVLVGRIKRRARHFRATAFHFYLAVFRTMLFRLLDVDDLCIGIANSNRFDSELQRTMGILVNLLPLRFKSPRLSTMTFGDAVKEASNTAYNALGNSRLPFNALLDNLTVDRSSSYHPLFQVFLDYRPGIPESWKMGDIEVQRLDWSYGKNAYDINLDIMENASGTAFITINAQEYLYGQPEVEILMKVFVNLLEAFSRNTALYLNEPPLFNESDTQDALTLARGPDLPSDWPETLSHRVEEIVQAHGERVAVRDEKGNQFTYQVMIEKMHQIANALSKAGVNPGDRVALLQQPTATTIASVLAIMHLGAVYVPLDLRSPIPRLISVLKDCKPRVIVYHTATEEDASALTLDDSISVGMINASTVPSEPQEVVANGASPNAEAVILYTSGSTGTPKGVVITHSSIRNVIEVLTKQFNLDAEVVLQQSALTFDLSLNQIFVALTNGGTLHVVDQSQRGDAMEIARLIKKADITYTMATPSEYSYWIRYGVSDLRLAKGWKLALSLGEELKPRLVEEFRSLNNPNLRLINTYGPAETTVHSHAVEVPYMDQALSRIPVGHALPNYSVYIVDKSIKPVPLGMPGQICVGGAGVSQGYLNLNSLTKECFVPNPFAPSDWVTKGWDRMYLTGDRGRLRTSDGALLFDGRMEGSTQIKLRGLRIELSEVEHAILGAASPMIDEVVVSVRGEGDDSDEFLVAHAVFSRHQDHGVIDEGQHAYLIQLLNKLPLPQYMVPAMIIPIDCMPLTSHNKIDRKSIAAMPLPRTDLGRGIKLTSQLTHLESELVGVWETVISRDLGTVSSPDLSFFHAGGNSLLLIPLQYMIKDKFYASLAMVDFADAHTIRKMAARIEQTTSAKLIDWEAETDVHLESLLSSKQSDKGAIISERRHGKDLHVLYTGATGHSASYVLKKLVNDDRISKIYCISVRSMDKLSNGSEKIIQFPGDLLDERLGLTEEQFTSLARDVDVIFHAAANRSFWDNYQIMRRANVLPAHTLISLAIPRKVPIHFMSSAAVHLFSGITDEEDYPETRATYPPPADGKDGYLASKWAAEKIFENASSQFGLPIYIHRPGPVREQVQQEGRLSKDTVFAEFMRIAQELQMNIPKGGIKGEIDLLELTGLAGVLSNCIIRSTGQEPQDTDGGLALVRYLNHHADMKLPLDEWEAYFEEHQAELPQVTTTETHHATEWIGRAKKIGFPYMLSAQNFDLTGESRLPIVQRR